ncbi:MAG: hypothetical protein K8H87_07305 [Pseudorhodoplanes sp.]|nr:hypothetical protein [Pseudorhodoplanes sp.]
MINAKIFRRAALLRAGGFDTGFSVVADRDLMLRRASSKPQLRLQYSSTPLYRYRIHPGSKTLQQTAKARVNIAREHCRIAERVTCDTAFGEHARRMAATWASHETAVLVLRSFETGDYRAGLNALATLGSGGLGIVADISAARRIRHTYAGWLHYAASGPPAHAAGART